MIIGIKPQTDYDIVQRLQQYEIPFLDEETCIKAMGLSALVNDSDTKIVILRWLDDSFGGILVASNVYIDEEVENWLQHNQSLFQNTEEFWDWVDYMSDEIGRVNKVTIEEKIKEAMSKLGINPDSKPAPKIDEPKKQEQKKEKQPENSQKPPQEHQKTDVMIKPMVDDKKEQEQAPTQRETTNSPSSLYLKVSGDRAVILIPDDLELETQVIGGKKYKTAVFKLPDFGGHMIEMPLVVHNTPELKKSEPPKPIQRKPIIVPKTQPQPMVNNDAIDGNLDSLQKQKDELTQKIKEARAMNDLRLSEELRKQRRKVRAKINELIKD